MASPDNQDSAFVFLMRDCLGMARDILEKSFAEKLNQREDIKAIECNVRLVGLSIGEGYTRFMPKEKLLGAFAGCEEDETWPTVPMDG